MGKIGIITNSVANLSSEIVKEKDIKVIPLKIKLGKQTFLDGIELKANDFYELLEKTEDVPLLEPPESEEFLKIFEALKDDGYEEAICILSSSSISLDYGAACEARDLVRPFPVVVIDSHTSTMCQGFMVLEAVRGVEAGLPLTEIVEKIWNMRLQVHFYAFAGMLHYLVRTKRLGKLSAYSRALLNIKPIITINKKNGTVQPMAKVKSRQEGVNFFLKKIDAELSGSGKKLHLAVVHSAEKHEAEMLLQEIEQKYNCAETYLEELTPALGCFTGPGVIGVSFFVE